MPPDSVSNTPAEHPRAYVLGKMDALEFASVSGWGHDPALFWKDATDQLKAEAQKWANTLNSCAADGFWTQLGRETTPAWR